MTTAPSAAGDLTTPAFPIVAIGASAGGLEAISALLAAMPAASGMAFLVVQHLDPTRPSLLVGILAERTAMPVVEAAEGMPIEPDRLYVIPPNASMSVAQRHIRLRPRDDTLGPPMPIDDLFESLARDQGACAIGVVLSGSGSDGALGLQAIQNESGVTFAQDEASAQFTGMPRAAINLQCVDFILPPRAIAREITRFNEHGRRASFRRDLATEDAEQGERPLRHMFRLLRNACEIDFTHYKRGTIQRRLSRRMALRQITSVADYVALLETDAAETRALGRDLLIQVTQFFRDAESFEALAQKGLPHLIGMRDARAPVRIWVPGCATGEEVYSIAICVLEHLGDGAATNRIQIFGTDVSKDALETARAGRYVENIARNVSPERLERFFVRDGDHYCVAKAVRNLCTFARHDVASDPPFSRMDLVSCRNVLIYLDPTLQKSIIPFLHYALNPDGVLMLGQSETVGAFSELFGVLDSKRTKLYTKKLRAERPASGLLGPDPAAPPSPVRAPRRSEAGPAPTDAEQLRREADRTALVRYLPPCVLCDEDLNIVEFRGDTTAYLLNPNGPPSTNLQRLARPELYLAISDALKQAREYGVPVRKTGLRLKTDDDLGEVNLEVHPVQVADMHGQWFLIFFEGPAQASRFLPPSRYEPLRALLLRAWRRRVGRNAARSAGGKAGEIARLNAELAATQAQLRAMLEEHESAREELKSSEEELLSSNEEFQSTNEELETAKEELQSVNEELSTTNDELRYRNDELKALNDRAAAARDYADAIVETMSEPLLVLDAALRVTRANQAFYRVFQSTPAQTLGTFLYSLGNEEWNIPALRNLLEDLRLRKTAIRDFRITHEFPRIGVRTMRLNAVCIEIAGEALILLTLDDITRQQQAFDRLQVADEQKNEFLAMLAHELRNPLATIRNGLQIWQRGDANEETATHARVAARRQLDHEIRLVEDLLDVSRVTRGLIALKLARIDLIETVRQAAEGMRGEIEARRHALTLDLPAQALIVEADAMRIEQVTTNLLANAIKYTPPGGHIAVSLARDGDDAVLTVVDNGIGMTREFLPTVFTIFVQAERALDRKSAGLGLGLALVSRLAQMHRGSVRAFSAGIGLGSRFVVRLPVLPQGTLPAPPAQTSSGAALPSAPKRILVVDDNVDSVESTAALLRLDGHEVRIACDGPSTLRHAQDFRPHIVLLDIGLPDMDGYEVARRLRAMPDQADTLLIAHSGYGEEEHRRRTRQAGFDHLLVKPADFGQLNALIASSREPRASAGDAG